MKYSSRPWPSKKSGRHCRISSWIIPRGFTAQARQHTRKQRMTAWGFYLANFQQKNETKKRVFFRSHQSPQRIQLRITCVSYLYSTILYNSTVPLCGLLLERKKNNRLTTARNLFVRAFLCHMLDEIPDSKRIAHFNVVLWHHLYRTHSRKNAHVHAYNRGKRGNKQTARDTISGNKQEKKAKSGFGKRNRALYMWQRSSTSFYHRRGGRRTRKKQMRSLLYHDSWASSRPPPSPLLDYRHATHNEN